MYPLWCGMVLWPRAWWHGIHTITCKHYGIMKIYRTLKQCDGKPTHFLCIPGPARSCRPAPGSSAAPPSASRRRSWPGPPASQSWTTRSPPARAGPWPPRPQTPCPCSGRRRQTDPSTALPPGPSAGSFSRCKRSQSYYSAIHFRMIPMLWCFENYLGQRNPRPKFKRLVQRQRREWWSASNIVILLSRFSSPLHLGRQKKNDENVPSSFLLIKMLTAAERLSL